MMFWYFHCFNVLDKFHAISNCIYSDYYSDLLKGDFFFGSIFLLTFILPLRDLILGEFSERLL